jgi:hypothetical protein
MIRIQIDLLKMTFIRLPYGPSPIFVKLFMSPSSGQIYVGICHDR